MKEMLIAQESDTRALPLCSCQGLLSKGKGVPSPKDQVCQEMKSTGKGGPESINGPHFRLRTMLVSATKGHMLPLYSASLPPHGSLACLDKCPFVVAHGPHRRGHRLQSSGSGCAPFVQAATVAYRQWPTGEGWLRRKGRSGHDAISEGTEQRQKGKAGGEAVCANGAGALLSARVLFRHSDVDPVHIFSDTPPFVVVGIAGLPCPIVPAAPSIRQEKIVLLRCLHRRARLVCAHTSKSRPFVVNIAPKGRGRGGVVRHLHNLLTSFHVGVVQPTQREGRFRNPAHQEHIVCGEKVTV